MARDTRKMELVGLRWGEGGGIGRAKNGEIRGGRGRRREREMIDRGDGATTTTFFWGEWGELAALGLVPGNRWDADEDDEGDGKGRQ